MDKYIFSLIEADVTAVDIDDTVESVEVLLSKQGLSCVPVVTKDGKCFGVISLSDLTHFHAIRKNSKAERAWEVCTHNVIEVPPDVTIKDAAELMIEKDIHHVVVMKNSTILGVVSSVDIIRAFLRQPPKGGSTL